MFNSPISKTQQQLVQAAREATTDYITNGTDLTEAVVKAASAITPLTSEHVRRICEMTYHDAYERTFAEKTGMYQYVSFDPPDAIRASEMLDALQLGFNNQANFDKLAMAYPMRQSPRSFLQKLIGRDEAQHFADMNKQKDLISDLVRKKNNLFDTQMSYDEAVKRDLHKIQKGVEDELYNPAGIKDPTSVKQNVGTLARGGTYDQLKAKGKLDSDLRDLEYDIERAENQKKEMLDNFILDRDATRLARTQAALGIGVPTAGVAGYSLNKNKGQTKEANYGKKIKDAFNSYMSTMSGSGIKAKKDAVDSALDVVTTAKKSFSDHKDTLDKLNAGVKRLEKQRDVFNKDYVDTSQSLSKLYDERKQVIKDLGLKYKDYSRKKPDLSKMNQTDLGHVQFAIPDIQQRVDRVYGQEFNDKLISMSGHLNRIKDDQKTLKGHIQTAKNQFSDAKKEINTFKSQITSAKENLRGAQRDLRATRGATNRARIGTGLAVAVPSGVYLSTRDSSKSKKQDKDMDKKASMSGIGDTVRNIGGAFIDTVTGSRLHNARQNLKLHGVEELSRQNKYLGDLGLDPKAVAERGRKLRTDAVPDQELHDPGIMSQWHQPTLNEVSIDYDRYIRQKEIDEAAVNRERNMMLGAQGVTGAVGLGGAAGLSGAFKKNNNNNNPQGAPMQKKAGISMPRKFQRMNTHELWTKAASGKELPDHNPTRSIQQVHRDLKDSISTVKSELYSAEHNEKLAMIDMVKQAKAGLSAGHSMEQVLHAAVSVVDATEPFMAKTAHDLCATIIEACADHQNSGFSKTAKAFSQSEYDKTINWYKGQLKKNPSNKAMRKDYESLVANKSSLVKSANAFGSTLDALGIPHSGDFNRKEIASKNVGGALARVKAKRGVKEAATLQDVNPNHPIPQKFKKLAEANIQRKHLEVTLDELNKNLDYFNEKLIDELTR